MARANDSLTSHSVEIKALYSAIGGGFWEEEEILNERGKRSPTKFPVTGHNYGGEKGPMQNRKGGCTNDDVGYCGVRTQKKHIWVGRYLCAPRMGAISSRCHIYITV